MYTTVTKAASYLLVPFALGALIVGCGPDEPPEDDEQPVIDVGTDVEEPEDAGTDAEPDTRPDTGPDAEPDTCEPMSCEEAGVQCGEVDDGCGGTLDCGGCEGDATCGEIAPNMCNCAPESDEEFCERHDKTCGRFTAEDNCGFERTATCGSCGENEECQSDNTCGCVEKTDVTLCSENDLNCGEATVEGRCSEEVEVTCGQCTDQGGDICVDNACVCEPFTCDEVHDQCGIYPDGCGGQITCEGGCSDTLLATGGYHTCFQSASSDQLECWGWNKYGQVGTGSSSTSDFNTPQSVTSRFDDLYSVTAGEDFTCVVDGTEAKCWGANYDSQALGRENDPFGNELREVLTPRSPDVPGTGISQINAGVNHTCALNTAGEVYCWGSNSILDADDGGGVLVPGPANPGQFDNYSVEPTQYEFGPTGEALSVEAGLWHSCGEATDGSLWCWGANFFGAIGEDEYFYGRDGILYTPPVKVPGFENGFVQVAAGGLDQARGEDRGYYANDFSCAIDRNNAAKCWGSDAFRGELGDGSDPEHEHPNRTQPEPVEVIGLDGDVLDLALGGAHGCAIQNSELWCWGGNEYGQIGNGKSGEGEQENVPVEVTMPDDKEPVNVEAGFYHTCAVLETDELACWGRNSDGQLGDGTYEMRTTPKIVYP